MNREVDRSAGIWARTAVFIASLAVMNLVLTDQHVRALYVDCDKLIHASVYFVVTLMLRWSTRQAPVRVACFAMALGALDELLQIGLAGRSADWADWAADCTGAVLAAVVLWCRGAPGACICGRELAVRKVERRDAE